MKTRSILIILLSIGLTISCGRKKESATVKTEAAPASGGGTVTLTRDQVKQAHIRTGTFEQVELSHDVNAPGRLDLPNANMASVSTMVNGIVSSIDVHIGDKVNKGSRLCRLVYPDIIQLQEDYVKAKLDMNLAATNYDRQKVLNDEKVTAGKVFQSSERDYMVAKAVYDGLKLKLQLAGFDMDALDRGEIRDYLDIRSPIRGTVDNIGVNLGSMASPDVTLFTVVCKEHMHLEAMVFEKDIPLVRVGQRVTFQLANFSDQIYQSKVFSIGSTIAPDTRAIPVYAEFEPVPEFIYPGMFVAVTIHTGEGIFNALREYAIITERENEHYIYYTTGDIDAQTVEFSRVPVKTGLTESGYVQVDPPESLPEGAKIVTNGGYYVRAEMMKSLE